MNGEIISELFGTGDLSEDYLKLLMDYRMSEEDGELIRDGTMESVSSLNRHGCYEDYEMMMFTIDEFRGRFSKRFEEIHGCEIDLDVLNRYKPNELYWQITDDIERTMQILEPYTGEDFANELFLKDLVKYNLLGQYISICGILCNTPSGEFIGRDVRQRCLLKFEELNLLDEIDERYPQSMRDAVRRLISSLSLEDIDVIHGEGSGKCLGLEYMGLEIWIRNEFGLNRKVNSKLIYECYTSEYNGRGIAKMGPLLIVDEASSVILEELRAEINRNYDAIKKWKLEGKIDKVDAVRIVSDD